MADMIRFAVFLLIFGCSSNGLAQQKTSESKFELLLEGGSLLPDQIEGVDEILGWYGIAAGLSTKNSTLGIEFSAGSGEGAELIDVSFLYRKDIPISSLFGTVGAGIDVIGLKRPGDEGRTYYGGGHFSGGLMALISKGLYVRMNMRFNLNPGVAMFLGFGLMYRPSEDI